MAEKNYYDILGVKKDATDAEIKKKYRKLVRQFHPDVSDDPDADSKIAEINNAYETIRDKDKRAEYDAMLNNPFAGQGGAGGFGGFGGQAGTSQGGFRWEDIKGQFGDGEAFGDGGFRFDDIFSAFGRGARGSAGGRSQSQGFDPFGGGFGTQDSKGQDQHAEITVDLSSVYQGDDYSIKLNVPVRQPNGEVSYDNKTLKIKIPKGITDGKQIRLSGQGAAGSSNGKNGDLFLKVKIRHDDNIRIEGADVYQTVNIAPWEAALGEKINVSTPAGKLGVTIPKNSKSGSNLRLKGKGIPAKQAGDLYLTLNIINPDVSSDAARQAYEQLKQAFADTTINR
ncbi:DnaJ C-terminal domain-containing protein [Psychrobacter sp. KCTC 72983]|uniref:DnaJ C-terminal domain-containing protein n=1 Tax=Psychrobacter sp. KCTC 72983 TaxID=2733866 RepID=UPI0016467CAB|nr:DnaJ C-terminal domain-containing protein [Psychrobacter sp. KCTC 72983]MEC9444206.1 DnaJ C-terminal domain-containing protein [Pseudomonadota bacterium]MED6317724.1 DnaJ C-terminal domain-containing protein [Pseudomonadota bacterium]